MAGVLLGQSASYGLTQQVTLEAGFTDGASIPAAGAEFSFVCGDYDFWRLIAIYFEITTDANAANRLVTVQYPQRGGLSPVKDGAGLVITANTTSQQFSGSLTRGVAEWATNTPVFFPLSGLWLEAGRVVKIDVDNIQAGDQLANILLTFDRVAVDPARYGTDQGSDLPE